MYVSVIKKMSIQIVEAVEIIDPVKEVEPIQKKRAGTPANKQRNFKCYKYEIIYVTKSGIIHHKKFSSSTEINAHEDIPINSKYQLYYYLTAKEKLNLKNLRHKYVMTVKK